jgi:hypothetical protein
MNTKDLTTQGDLELVDQAGIDSPLSGLTGNASKDDSEMAYYGKPQQLKVYLQTLFGHKWSKKD